MNMTIILSGFFDLEIEEIKEGTMKTPRESSVQSALVREGYPAAKERFGCTDMSILGGVFFVMEIFTPSIFWSMLG